jgi:hypothetical protein
LHGTFDVGLPAGEGVAQERYGRLVIGGKYGHGLIGGALDELVVADDHTLAVVGNPHSGVDIDAAFDDVPGDGHVFCAGQPNSYS